MKDEEQKEFGLTWKKKKEWRMVNLEIRKGEITMGF